MSARRAPYPAYKDSGIDWLGEVPEGWEVLRLRFRARINPPRSEAAAVPQGTRVSFVPMEAIQEQGGLILSESKDIDEVASGYTYFCDGDVVVAKITPCFENGKGALASGLENGVAFGTTELHVMRPGSSLNGRFLFNLTMSQPFRALGGAEMYGAGGQKRVPESFIRDFRMPLPPLPEQRAIAAFLDRETARIDGLIAKKERQVELLQEKRAAVISHAVTKGVVHGFMFDTNIFDRILNENIQIEDLAGIGSFYVTHVQHSEIHQISDPRKAERKQKLLEIYKEVNPAKLPTWGMVWGADVWDEAIWNETDPTDALRATSPGDMLIGQTALKHGLTVVSDDRTFQKAIRKMGGQAVSFVDFQAGRYRQMKDSGIEWLGEVPEGWEVKRIVHLLERIQDGTHFSPESHFSGAFMYITAKNIKERGIDVTEITYVTKEVHDEIYRRCPVKKGDVLYIKDGATAGIATVNMLNEQFSMLSSVAMLRPKEYQYDARFLAYHLNMAAFKSYVLNSLVGGAMTRFTIEVISKFILIAPPLPEQQAIAAFLDRETGRIDVLLGKVRQSIDLLREYRQSAISATVTGKIDVREEVA